MTALTLHADPSHLVANVTAGVAGDGGVSAVGGGLGAALTVAAGAGTPNAWPRPPHVSIGASTASWCGGSAERLAFARTRRTLRRRGRAWLPLAAGLALLGMLGSDPRTDLGAHLCGFVVGVALGAITGWAMASVPGRWVQRTLAVATAVAVAASWWLALRAA